MRIFWLFIFLVSCGEKSHIDTEKRYQRAELAIPQDNTTCSKYHFNLPTYVNNFDHPAFYQDGILNSELKIYFFNKKCNISDFGQVPLTLGAERDFQRTIKSNGLIISTNSFCLNEESRVCNEIEYLVEIYGEENSQLAVINRTIKMKNADTLEITYRDKLVESQNLYKWVVLEKNFRLENGKTPRATMLFLPNHSEEYYLFEVYPTFNKDMSQAKGFEYLKLKLSLPKQISDREVIYYVDQNLLFSSNATLSNNEYKAQINFSFKGENAIRALHVFYSGELR